ncbi:MAG: biotin--[acetyl-CoA-carboxylase] ligase, partial [Actinobacteria bacterium]|nr:biotin--[acetyl-CoA-carboxylase] ligase [Actinomycetota bacterium]
EAPVRWEEVTGSTNDTALAMAEAGAPEWTLVGAGHQTAGRGRLGRHWHDLGAPHSLVFSFVLRPTIAPAQIGLLALLAGAAMADASGTLGRREVSCKWPNDLIVDEAHKAAGILAESKIAGDRVAYAVVGIGANLGSIPAAAGQGGLLGDIDPVELVSSFLAAFRAGYEPQDEEFPTRVLAAYRPLCSTLGRRVRVQVGGRLVGGRAVDVDEAGGLVVQTARGRETVSFGDVELLR